MARTAKAAVAQKHTKVINIEPINNVCFMAWLQKCGLTRIRRINLQMHVQMKIHGQILFSTGLSRFPSLGEPYVPHR